MNPLQQILLPASAYSSDPNLAKDVLLLPCTGLNGGTTFTDLSPSPKAITVHNSAKTSTAQGYAAGSSLDLIVGTDDWLDAANSADFDFGSGDFTFEMFIKLRTLPSAGGAYTFCAKRATSAVFAPWQFFVLPTGSPGILCSTSGSAWDVNISGPAGNMGIFPVFVHAWFGRSGTTFVVGTNGNIVAKGTKAGALMVNAANVAIGAAAMDGTFSNDGQINHVRATKGLCRYNAAAAIGSSYGDIPSTPAVPFPSV